MIKQGSLLNTYFNKSSLKLDDGEKLIREIGEMKEELGTFREQIDSLASRSDTIVPLKARRENVHHPIKVRALCAYKQLNVSFISSQFSRDSEAS